MALVFLLQQLTY